MGKSAKKSGATSSQRGKVDSFPLVRWRKLRGDPPPISNAGRYVRRVVKLSLTDGEVATLGSISSVLGHGGDFVITSIRMWGALGNTSVTFAAFPGALLAGVSQTAQSVIVTDEGTQSSRPAVEFTVPRSHAVSHIYTTGSTQKVFSIVGTAGSAYVTCMQFAAAA